MRVLDLAGQCVGGRQLEYAPDGHRADAGRLGPVRVGHRRGIGHGAGVGVIGVAHPLAPARVPHKGDPREVDLAAQLGRQCVVVGRDERVGVVDAAVGRHAAIPVREHLDVLEGEQPARVPQAPVRKPPEVHHHRGEVVGVDGHDDHAILHQRPRQVLVAQIRRGGLALEASNRSARDNPIWLTLELGDVRHGAAVNVNAYGLAIEKPHRAADCVLAVQEDGQGKWVGALGQVGRVVDHATQHPSGEARPAACRAVCNSVIPR
mmetsp:Transcript_38029/g.123032  ORF Transcript_38029/g.123032 Transcript_38029/m.123032 type:complete len:263 (+) Transcript_38029:1364-2152(+)